MYALISPAAGPSGKSGLHFLDWDAFFWVSPPGIQWADTGTVNKKGTLRHAWAAQARRYPHAATHGKCPSLGRPGGRVRDLLFLLGHVVSFA